jgi:hypothetical protein
MTFSFKVLLYRCTLVASLYSVLRQTFLFFCNTECTNNNNHFQTLLTLISIFLIQQCVLFWGATTAQPGANDPGGLQFSNAEAVHLLKKKGNFNNVKICRGKFPNVLAYECGVLAVECLPKDGELPPPAGGLNYNFTVLIPRDQHTPDCDGSDEVDEIRALLEIRALRGHGRDPNVTITATAEGDVIAVSNAGANTGFNFFF